MQQNDDLHGAPGADTQLSEALREWRAPQTPAALEKRVLGAAAARAADPQPWWRFLLNGYIRVPVPLACCLMALMIFAAWRTVRPASLAPCSLALQPVACTSPYPGAC